MFLVASGRKPNSPTDSEEVDYQQAKVTEDPKRDFRTHEVQKPAFNESCKGDESKKTKPRAGLKAPPSYEDRDESQMTGKANDSSDNLVRLVGNVMQTMRDELRKMNSKIDANIGKESHAKDLPKSTGTPRVNEAKTWWYAVINGKDNTRAVFPDWIGGAAEYLMGVSVKKYDSYDQAWAQVAAHKQLLTGSANTWAQTGPQATLPYQQPGWSKPVRLKEEAEGEARSTRSESLP
jgi:hypothetical protein